ncbi:AraC family transcriptional regulator [Neobacillus sp. NPDC097160]|uniref:AraC family transcriptional regulator n=1 Tax=Neobacillus sp. NPDC097160 TaxID=3364298 RepID=UPI00382CE8EE
MEPLTDLIGELRTYNQWENTHQHQYGQLIFPLEGNLVIKTKIHNLLLNDDKIFFLLPNCEHSFFSKTYNKFLILNIPKTFISLKNQDGSSIVYDVSEKWKAIRYLVLNEISKANNDNSGLRELFSYVSRQLYNERKPPSILFIHQNYNQKLGLNTLAQIENYNPTYYLEWFYKNTGKTPYQYITEIRVKKAKELLEQTDLSHLEIAIQIGFEHQSSFTRVFKKIEGITPSLYRKSIRDN